MGTNYYWYPIPPCSMCHRPATTSYHIGKSSAGWVFALHTYPTEGIHDLYDWMPMLLTPGADIRDEYDTPIPAQEMIAIITERRAWQHCEDVRDPTTGVRTTRLVPLKRHLVDHMRVLKHGKGTWDCFANHGDYW